MSFWDSSALVALWTEGANYEDLRQRYDEARDPIVVWWTTPVECVSAIARREREGVITAAEASSVVNHVRKTARTWQTVTPTEAVRERAYRLLRTHPLRSADALQLAAALVVAGDSPAAVDFLTRDARLSEAAAKEGLNVIATD
jgi:predicted nucleic acid-binding protein